MTGVLVAGLLGLVLWLASRSGKRRRAAARTTGAVEVGPRDPSVPVAPGDPDVRGGRHGRDGAWL